MCPETTPTGAEIDNNIILFSSEINSSSLLLINNSAGFGGYRTCRNHFERAVNAR